jgi:hypothetical protein
LFYNGQSRAAALEHYQREEACAMTQLSSAFLNKRELDQLRHEELEDLDYHLQNRRQSLLQKMEQITRDLRDLENDREKIVTELNKRQQHS